jgi:hypothetical protein
MNPERLFTLLELAVVQRERSFFLAGREACEGRNRSGIGSEVRRKRTGHKSLGVRGQELLWYRKRGAQEAYRQRTRQLPAIVLQLTQNKEC